MEIKRAAELSLCALLKEALSDLDFYPSRGGGDDITPDWQASHNYKIGDVIRPTDHTKTKAVVVTVAGNSGVTQPSFTNVTGSIYGTAPRYETTASLAISEAVDAGNPKPPFCVVSIDDAEKTMSQEETNYLTGSIVWVTRADSTNIVEHSRNFKRIYDALASIGSGYDILRRIIIHGVDIGRTDEFTDEAKQAHGDTISFSMGVTEKLSQG